MQNPLIFEKYQGTGNDFIIINQMESHLIQHSNQELITRLCDRHFGIGADGLILLEKSASYDFKMVYFNADGKQSTMCGNGGRCMIQFAHQKGLFGRETIFEAVDGIHRGKLSISGDIHLEMSDVDTIQVLANDAFELNTGSPHLVQFGQIPEDVKQAGASIRYNDQYRKAGINVNFVSEEGGLLQVATYERGVEDETFSCGTGVTAAALAFAVKEARQGEIHCSISTKGGMLSVTARRLSESSFTDIWLIGPALKVFEGTVIL